MPKRKECDISRSKFFFKNPKIEQRPPNLYIEPFGLSKDSLFAYQYNHMTDLNNNIES